MNKKWYVVMALHDSIMVRGKKETMRKTQRICPAFSSRKEAEKHTHGAEILTVVQRPASPDSAGERKEGDAA